MMKALDVNNNMHEMEAVNCNYGIKCSCFQMKGLVALLMLNNSFYFLLGFFIAIMIIDMPFQVSLSANAALVFGYFSYSTLIANYIFN